MSDENRPSLAELRKGLLAAQLDPEMHATFSALLDSAEAYLPLVTYRESAEYHEDFGDVLWWRLSKHSGKPEEPPYCGSPLNDDWPYGMDGDDEGDTWEYDFKGDTLKWTPLPRPYDAPGVRP